MIIDTIHVSSQKARQFASKGIYTVEDLINFFPRKYKDYSKMTGILDPEYTSVFQVQMNQIQKKMGRVSYMIANCTDVVSGSPVHVFWYNSSWMFDHLYNMKGSIVTVIGKVTHNSSYNSFQVNQPEVFEPIDCLKIYPVYSAIRGMSDKYLTDKIDEAIGLKLNMEELPEDIVKSRALTNMRSAIQYLHHPQTMEEIEEGKTRIVLNDLIYFAVHNELNERSMESRSKFKVVKTNLMNKIEANLPFHLTLDQRKAVDNILHQAMHGRRINSLVCGDVGCGKTIICALIAAAMIENGYQVVLMAPTQVLAKQHYDTFCELLDPYGIKLAFLHSGMKKKEHSELLNHIADGTINMVIGTHACIARDVEYKKLALTIVDEEHKFGVKQRTAIVEKASKGVHNITMSATPIPRSLAQIIYGSNVDLEAIKTMPTGRKPVLTGISRDKEKTMRFLLKEIRAGHQAYVVCPLVEANDNFENVYSVEEISQDYRKALEPFGVRIATLSGKDKPEYTEDTINKFKNGEYDVLIATTVIEVGVNVPNATMMIISNAERFGFSSLHQLRGRVGRSDLQSYCVLMTDATEGKAMDRLNIMCETTDGFKIAEADLKLRGTGDLLGTQQSGMNKYIELMTEYPELYDEAVEIASELIRRGPLCCKLMRRISEERTIKVD